jgi:uncharacterized protein (DUF2336 family)
MVRSQKAKEMPAESKLSVDDLKRLMVNPSSDARAITAEKLGNSFAAGQLSDSERALAEQIFRLMARDIEVKVRKSLSDSIKLAPNLPRDVAMQMANDVADIALPVIEASTVLTDEDLMAIIESKPAEYQVAVAARPIVSEAVSDALVATNNEAVVTRLVSNDGAVIKEETLSKVLDNFGHLESVVTPMAGRATLPVAAAERLVALVSEKVRDHLVTHHQLNEDVAMDLILSSRERATLSLISGEDSAPDVMELVDQLARNGRLAPSIMMRALCLGDMVFFEAALARRAGISITNTYQLIHDRGGKGLSQLFVKAKLPEKMLPVVRTALAVAAEADVSHHDRHAMRNIVLERVLTQFGDDIEDFDYLIAKLSSGPAHQPVAA